MGRREDVSATMKSTNWIAFNSLTSSGGTNSSLMSRLNTNVGWINFTAVKRYNRKRGTYNRRNHTTLAILLKAATSNPTKKRSMG